MQLLYATHFQISPRRDETTTAAFDRIKAQTQNWIIEWYARNGHRISIPSGDHIIEPLPGDFLSVRTQGPLSDGTTQTRVIWRHGDSRNEGLVWHVTATISIAQSLIEAGFTVSLAAASFRPLPKSVPIGRPRIVRELLASEQCSINGLPIGIAPQFVGDSEMSDFAENLLCSPDRAIPLLLISPYVDGSLSVEPKEVADKLAGLCIVVALESSVCNIRAHESGWAGAFLFQWRDTPVLAGTVIEVKSVAAATLSPCFSETLRTNKSRIRG
jgi:hypothetical protein